MYLEVRQTGICPVNMLMTISIQMYDDTMTAIHNHLIQQSFKTKMTYTCELIPERNHKEKCMSSGVDDPWWMRSPDNPLLIQLVSTNTKTRPLSLLSQWVGVITTGAVVKEVSIPPKPHELTKITRLEVGG